MTQTAENPIAEWAAPAPDPEGLSWSDLRRAVGIIAEDQGEWGGLPIPVEHVRLVMEPRYPFPKLSGTKLNEEHGPAEPAADVVNSWFDYRRNAQVVVFREDGKSHVGIAPHGPGARLRFWMNTFGVAASNVWDLTTEARALEKLDSLVTSHAFNCYVLSGSFLETSKRSGVTYLFRKLRPTIALRPTADGHMEVIAVLCLHPLGYYAESWAGVMCPTDDVIAHLILMRGDEHRFWKKANHHSMWMASAGI